MTEWLSTHTHKISWLKSEKEGRHISVSIRNQNVSLKLLPKEVESQVSLGEHWGFGCLGSVRTFPKTGVLKAWFSRLKAQGTLCQKCKFLGFTQTEAEALGVGPCSGLYQALLVILRNAERKLGDWICTLKPLSLLFTYSALSEYPHWTWRRKPCRGDMDHSHFWW